ncbi:hypothetical protein [Staphylococcus canis]|uniref:Uncharacterized protein n=1 Tax=Staphylococcus canis TaxID=2724942 RepID=A0ABS0T8H6_9STAP|nr:hypothetical protein [Staphylococcus canis]MBI5975056.1 hypothetical protein [Staphylococcus canis]
MSYKWLSTIFFVMSVLILFKALYQLYVYDNSAFGSINTYVGGDAYNYIINANRATAYFTISGFLMIGGLLTEIMYLIEYGKGEYRSIMTIFRKKREVQYENYQYNVKNYNPTAYSQTVMYDNKVDKEIKS